MSEITKTILLDNTDKIAKAEDVDFGIRYSEYHGHDVPTHKRIERPIMQILEEGEQYVSFREWVAIYYPPNHALGRMIPIRQKMWRRTTLKVNKYGKVVCYRSEDGRQGVQDRSLIFIRRESDHEYPDMLGEVYTPYGTSEFRQAIERVFGGLEKLHERIVRERRPLWADGFDQMRPVGYLSGGGSQHALGTWMRFGWSHKTPIRFVKEAFGEAYNRRVIRVLAKYAQRMSPLEWTRFVTNMATYVQDYPIEWILDYLEAGVEHLPSTSITHFGGHVGFPEDLHNWFSLRRQFEVDVSGREYVVRDTSWMLRQLPAEVVGDLQPRRNMSIQWWEAYHDRIATLHRALTQEQRDAGRAAVLDREIPFPEGHSDLQHRGLDDTGLTLRFPTNGHDMLGWSEKMSNCISGYIDRAANGQGIYLGIYKDGEVYANVEIVEGRCTQLLGKHNRAVPEFHIIYNWLVGVGLITQPDISNTWGNPEREGR